MLVAQGIEVTIRCGDEPPLEASIPSTAALCGFLEEQLHPHERGMCITRIAVGDIDLDEAPACMYAVGDIDLDEESLLVGCGRRHALHVL